MTTAHKFIEDSAIFEDIENRTVEVVPITLAHQAVKIACKEAHNEAYQDVLSVINSRRSLDMIGEFEVAFSIIEDYIKHKMK